MHNTLPPEREDALYYRKLSDGGDLTVYALGWGWGQLALSRAGTAPGCIDESFYYETRKQAIAAAEVWDGKGDAPVGWFRHVQSGRRREDGDPAKEYFQP